MYKPKTKECARATLLDRLVDENPHVAEEAKPLRTLDRAGLRQSVRRELERLLNTRASYPPEILNRQERSALNYGIPDYYHLSPKSPSDHRVLELDLTRAISFYEPRLQDVRVEVQSYDEDRKALIASVEGVIVVESIRDPVSFPFTIQLKDGDFKLDGDR